MIAAEEVPHEDRIPQNKSHFLGMKFDDFAPSKRIVTVQK